MLEEGYGDSGRLGIDELSLSYIRDENYQTRYWHK